MKQFYTRIAICLVPCLLAAGIVANALHRYNQGEGGFKFGVDLVGGTILIYEVADPDNLPPGYDPNELAASLKRRIDPADLYNVTIRPASRTRVEIILPTGGKHQMDKDREAWDALLTKVKDHWPQLKDDNLDVSRGLRQELINRVDDQLKLDAWKAMLAKVPEKWAKLKDTKLSDVPPGRTDELITRIKKQDDSITDGEIKQFVDANYQPPPAKEVAEFVAVNYGGGGGQRKEVTEEEIDRIKKLIEDVGNLQFMILANDEDDKQGVAAARKYLRDAASDPAIKEALEKANREGMPPPAPRPEEGEAWPHKYGYVEIGRSERKSLGLDNASAASGPHWKRVEAARTKGEAYLWEPLSKDDMDRVVIYSREIDPIRAQTLPKEDQGKKYEYFFLVREPEPGKEITGKYLITAGETVDQSLKPAVSFRFDNTGGNLFWDVTSANKPTGPKGGEYYRHLAIVLDNQIMSAPRLLQPIRTDGQITGNFTQKDVRRLITILRGGALPATLKRTPVSESTIGATLGSDTIRSGSLSIVLAFLSVIAFMIIYYRFAGLVASVALLANLLLTVAFMVAVNATFTLPGLAGIVLMLGMAVDANVLIYERIREERDRGASLALSIRNGYDRAFATIIDTHLSSIFTAIVLYAVGNDQLKGFGVSLTVGLIISLFTSLYMTRLMFDVWLYKGWLPKLSMLRFFSRPNIDFMRIRYYWFTATVILTMLGITLFLVRGKQGLDIDFTGGTAYSGQLNRPMKLEEIRHLLDQQGQKLHVAEVKEVSPDGLEYTVRYEGQPEARIRLPNAPPGGDTAQREADIRRRAGELPDTSVEQIFLSTEGGDSGESSLFTIRTSEKAVELVQLIINQLMGDELKKITVAASDVSDKGATLNFKDAKTGAAAVASPNAVARLLEREFKSEGITQKFQPVGVGKNQDGRYATLNVRFSDAVDKDKLQVALQQAAATFANRPLPERLENFDSALAAETKTQAMWAILFSWGAILLYLWFRFGNWTFGLAAVLCLMHDLFFTLGIIAACHYLHGTWLGNLLALGDFKINLVAVAALLTLVGYSVNDTIVVFDRIREIRGKNPELTPQMINDSVNGTLSRTLLASLTTWLVVIVLYIWGGEGVHLFAFVMVVGVIVGTYSSIYIASPLLLMFGEGKPSRPREPRPEVQPEGALA